MNTEASTPGRDQTFSSSSIWKLIKKGTRPMTKTELIDFKKLNPKSKKKNTEDGFSEAGLTYIKQVVYEVLLGRQINTERTARTTSWGRLVEKYVALTLQDEYKLVSQDRLFHPEISCWSGAPDVIKKEVVGDIKCPTLEVFCDKVKALKDLEVYKDEYPEDYWQLISNAILAKKKFAEAIIYAPYKKEIPAIKEMATLNGDYEFQWITYAKDDELPFLIEGKHYKNLNIFRFEVPKEDKKLLTERVLEAEKLMVQKLSEEITFKNKKAIAS